jgi:NAD-dependent deacetylase
VYDLTSGLRPTPSAPVVWITGAGFSAPSGIPTFRGTEGYWTVGSRVYQPQELATFEAWRRMPREVWRWYLYRKGVCDRAAPNAAHDALAALEARLGDAFRLVTQNVDGLHRRAGSARLYEIHGNIDQMRDERTDELLPIPEGCAVPDRDAPLHDAAWERLVNPRTGNRCRPHVLWFDEVYEEALYRSDSAVRAARTASAVIVVGTSGAARLPWLCAQAGMANGAVLVDVNPEDDPFRELARGYARGAVLEAGAVEGVRELVARIVSAPA